jgi:hypothetical protein
MPGPRRSGAACGDITRTESDGRQLAPIKSEFELPREYRESIADKVRQEGAKIPPEFIRGIKPTNS